MSTQLGPTRAAVCLALLSLAAGTFAINCWRLQTFRVAGPLDMAYYNQQLFNLGRAPITVRPQNAYATEGPAAWRTNHLRPITFLVAPLYRLYPRPETLFALGSSIVAAGVLVVYRIVSRDRGAAAGAVAATLYASAPPLWLVTATDFRYMYLGIPVGLLVADSLQRRRVLPFLAAVVLWATIREPYSIVLATLGIAHAVSNFRNARDRRFVALALGLAAAWFVLHVAYLAWAYGFATAGRYLWAVTHPTEAYGMVQGAVPRALQREATRLALHFAPLVLLGIGRPVAMAAGVLLLLPPMRMGLFSLHPAVQYVRYICPALVLLLWAAVMSVSAFWSSRWGRLYVIALLCLQFIALSVVLGPGPSWLDGSGKDGLLTFPARYSTVDQRAGVAELLRRIPTDQAVVAPRGVLLNLSPRTVLYDYYQPGPGLEPLEVARRARWLVVEKAVFLLVGAEAPVRAEVWRAIRQTAGATGVKDRSVWERFVRWLARIRAGEQGWRVIYEGAELMVLRRDPSD